MPQLTIQATLDLALRHHQAGRLGAAESLYRQILAQQPGHADALHMLGVVAQQVGRFAVAVELIRQAIVQQPHWPQAHYNLGNALRDAGQLPEAMAAFRQAIALQPNFAEAYNNLGSILKEKGDPDAAIAACRQAIALKPDYAESHNNLGNALRDKGNLDQAIVAFRQALALSPKFAEAHNNLGNVLKDTGQWDEAAAAYGRAIALNPNYAEAYSNFGVVLKAMGRLDEAIVAYHQAIALNANYAEAYSNLGVVLKAKERINEAIAAYRQAIALNPNHAEAYSNLGVVMRETGHLDEALAACRRAVALKPDLAEAYSNLGIALNDTGQVAEAIAAYRQAVALKPNYAEAHSNLVLTMHYHPGCGTAAIAQEHQRWNQQHAEPLKKFIRPGDHDRNPQRRLRIGYVSADFSEHPVGRFLLPLLANHDHRQVEVFAYAKVSAPDTLTARLRTHTDVWRSLVGRADAEAAELIRHDHIDILVDLAGHTARNQLLLFARQPAPLQVSYLGYPNSTGLTTMDYRLTDAYADPPGQTELYHAEQLIRLHPCAWCFAPLYRPPITPRRRGPITFGCFNNFAKVTEPMLQIWCRILLALPESRLLLKSVGLGSASVRQRVAQLLGTMGVDPRRVELRGLEADYTEHLALYGQMDIALDTFPYHGTATTCDALWMGVPVVSLAGPSHVSRVGVSLLSSVGLPELVANTTEEYLRIAVEWANDPPRLNDLRAAMRQRMTAAPLMDAPRFAGNVEAAYRQIWRKWCVT